MLIPRNTRGSDERRQLENIRQLTTMLLALLMLANGAALSCIGLSLYHGNSLAAALSIGVFMALAKIGWFAWSLHQDLKGHIVPLFGHNQTGTLDTAHGTFGKA